MSLRYILPDLIVEKIVLYIRPQIIANRNGKVITYNLCIHCHSMKNINQICEKCKYYSCSLCSKLDPIICTYCGVDTTKKMEKHIYKEK